MKLLCLIFFSLCLYFHFTGCVKPCLRSSNEDEHLGIIASEFRISSNCFKLGQSLSYPMVDEFVIDNDSVYKSWIDTSDLFYNPQCSSEVVTPIDFNTYTLLGKYTEGGCDVQFIREVQKNDDEKMYIYTIGVNECGICKKLQMSWNWVLVPKLPQGYTVKFIVKSI